MCIITALHSKLKRTNLFLGYCIDCIGIRPLTFALHYTLTLSFLNLLVVTELHLSFVLEKIARPFFGYRPQQLVNVNVLLPLPLLYQLTTQNRIEFF